MANLTLNYLVDMEIQLTWKLCLMTLGRMIALSTHSRLCSELGFDKPHKLPLACPSHHPVSKEVKQRVHGLSWSSYERRSETAVQRLNSMHEGVVRVGQILQRNNLEDPFDLSESESESEPEFDAGPDDEPDRYRVKGTEKDKRGMMDQHGNLKTPDFWSGHDPQVLSLSAMLVHEYYGGQPADGQLTEPRYRHDGQWRVKCEELALTACRDVISMCQKRGFKIQNLSMIPHPTLPASSTKPFSR